MREVPTFLGKDERLFGIVNMSDESGEADSKPAILLLNAGLIHRVGPNRLNVDLARRLAGAGFTAVRFDMSGIGDSDRDNVDRPYPEQTTVDIVNVMDSLEEKHAMTSFVLTGLCTGAYNALAAAWHDPRVAGCVLIDGYAYPTLKYQALYQMRRVSQGWRWKRYVTRRLGLAPSGPGPVRTDDLLVFQPEDLPKDEFRRRITDLTERGCEVYLVYTGFGPSPYNYEHQLWDSFPSLDRSRVSLAYLPEANHTFTLPVHRDQIVESISEWVQQRFGEGRHVGGRRSRGGPK